MFQPIKGLPPARYLDQSIELKQGEGPVNIRPYRYPQFQKDEIEPSTSPFSHPILLVKKRMEVGGFALIIEPSIKLQFLMQQGHLLAFFSHALPPTHRLKAIYERELITIVLAVQKWQPYLLGRRFTIRTDQKSLKFLLEQRIIAREYQKWVAKLIGYDFVIEYKKGLENTIADALSRILTAAELFVVSCVAGINTAVFVAQIEYDEGLRKIQRT